MRGGSEKWGCVEYFLYLSRYLFTVNNPSYYFEMGKVDAHSLHYENTKVHVYRDRIIIFVSTTSQQRDLLTVSLV